MAEAPVPTVCDSIAAMTTDTPMTPHRPTLMTVHAHPDDETIGTGGTMAKAVQSGHRVILATCTRGELGEIVVPDMDTADNHRRLGEIRAGELERAMGHLGVTEWENLGYRDSGMMGTDGNRDPRCFWTADLDEAAGRLTWLVRQYQPDVITTYNDYGGYGHPDHIRTHDVAVRAFERAGDPAWYPEQLDGTGLAPWAPSKLYEQAIPASVRERMNAALKESGQKSFWDPPEDATPEQIAEWEARAAKMLVPDEQITTWVDISGAPMEAKWKALHEHVTQLSQDSGFMALGFEGWKEGWSKEAYILTSSKVESSIPESDLFAGIV
jgi:N-acetyl-1-D-myo-inositol-2-amino-2-deoxy-alpha-D-glucopyranoside deacetylase